MHIRGKAVMLAARLRQMHRVGEAALEWRT
jgi:hypothetical protein